MWTNPGNEVGWELSWHLVETNKILSDSFNKITINKAHCIVWFERRHHLVLAWLIHFGHYIHLGHHDFPKSWQTGEKKTHFPCPHFGESCFLGRSQIQDPVKIFNIFPFPHCIQFAWILDPLCINQFQRCPSPPPPLGNPGAFAHVVSHRGGTF